MNLGFTLTSFLMLYMDYLLHIVPGWGVSCRDGLSPCVHRRLTRQLEEMVHIYKCTGGGGKYFGGGIK
jgi:hypothetical protein